MLRWILPLLLIIATRVSAAKIVVTVPETTPADASIFVAGPVEGGWKADALRLTRYGKGKFVGDIGDGRQHVYPFKITRGSWSTVEKAKDGSEIPNRELAVDAVGEVTITVERWADEGGDRPRLNTTVVGTLQILQLDHGDERRTLRVWLPATYESNPETLYPVLYMHDGQNCFDAATSAFGSEWRIDESLTKLIGDGKLAPLIVVGIDNAGERRIDEYTPHADRGRGGKGEAYERFVVQVVKPYIDAHFRTRSGREHAYLGGSSLGGLISLDMVRRYPSVFGGALVLSPSLWWADEALTHEFEREGAPGLSCNIVMVMGAREGDEKNRNRYVEQARRFGSIIERTGAPIRLTIDEKGEHNEESWARQFPEAVQLLLGSAP